MRFAVDGQIRAEIVEHYKQKVRLLYLIFSKHMVKHETS